MMRPAPFSWIPYTPPPGSYVELLPDGRFRLEGHDALLAQDETVSVQNTVLAASKEAGTGEPLSLHLFRGAKPLHVLLCYGDLDGGGVEQWFRHEPQSKAKSGQQSAGGTNPTQSPSMTQPLPKPARVALPRAHDDWFKVGFFAFLLWYLFMHHHVFRGVEPTERYPFTVPRSSDDDYAPPQHIYHP